jgi:hypothetical protein
MPKKNKNLGLILAILALAVFAIGVFSLLHSLIRSMRQGQFSPPYQQLHQRKISADNIRGWMTFGYINKSFDLPPEYLKNNLSIIDKKYPNISIDSWAKKSREDRASLLEQVKALVLAYQNRDSSSTLSFR